MRAKLASNDVRIRIWELISDSRILEFALAMNNLNIENSGVQSPGLGDGKIQK